MPVAAQIKYLAEHHPEMCKYSEVMIRYVQHDPLVKYQGNLAVQESYLHHTSDDAVMAAQTIGERGGPGAGVFGSVGGQQLKVN